MHPGDLPLIMRYAVQFVGLIRRYPAVDFESATALDRDAWQFRHVGTAYQQLMPELIGAILVDCRDYLRLGKQKARAVARAFRMLLLRQSPWRCCGIWPCSKARTSDSR